MDYKEILHELEKEGHKAAFAEILHIDDLKAEFYQLINDGKVNTEVLNNIVEFDFDYSKLEYEPKSVLVIAVKLPIIHNDFVHNEKIHTLVTPPGYIPGKESRKLKADVERLITNNGYKHERTLVPIKLLASKLGLTEYGRNNITYVKEFGSFHMLVAYYTDIHVKDTAWMEAKRMDICDSCNQCINMCPTDCIDENKEIINIEKCITRIYEDEGVFPEWIKEDHHNCLMACIKCQESCPANKSFLHNIDVRASFNKEETDMLLSNTDYDKLNDETKEKLKDMGLDGYYDIFIRNLGVQPQFKI